MTARIFGITGPVPVRRWATFFESYGQELVLLAVILLLFLGVGLANPRFLGSSNLISLFAGNAYIAVAAIGMSLVIISGHIDVSVGSLIGVLATISGTLAVHGYPIIIAWLAPLILGMAINAFVGVLIAYLADSLHRDDARHALDPEGRADQRHRRRLDHQSAAGLSHRPIPPLRRSLAGLFHGGADHIGRALGPAFGLRAQYLCHRRQSRGGTGERHPDQTFGRDGLRHPWAFRRDRRGALRDPASGHPIHRAGQSRVDGHHRLGGRRRQHIGRHRHGDRLDPGRHPFRHHRLLADLPERLRLLAARGAGPADPRHRAGRYGAPASDPGVRAMSLTRLLRHETILAVLLAAALIVLAGQSDKFFTTDNLLNQGRLMAEVGLVALPMTFIIVTGGIDLSVGSIFGLAAILLGVFWKNLGVALPVAMIAAVLVGGIGGLVNGVIITRFRVPPLIATLATLALYRGLAEGISQARSVRGYPHWFFVFGQGELLGVPSQLWLLVILAIAAAVMLGLTTFGRTVYAIGSNETAARFSGLHVDRAKMVIYGCSGLVAGLAGVIFVSRVSTTRSDMGTGLELDVITAVVLGGTSIFGGRGTIIGTALGLALMQALKDGLSLSGVKGDGTIVVIGLVLIAAVLIGNLLSRNGDG